MRLGAAIRDAQARSHTADAGSGAGVRPHVRRAHWHTFLSGARLREDGSAIPSSARRRELRWMPPVPVNVRDLDELPAVIHPVQQKITPCDFPDGLAIDPVNRAATGDLMHGTDCRGV